jgi:hypothetical protein
MNMTNKKRWMSLLSLLLVFSLISGCNLPTAVPPPPTETIVPTDTASPPPTETPEPQEPERPAVISAGNAADLVFTSLGLPEWPMRLVWLSSAAPIPDYPEQRPDLLLQGETGLHPVIVWPQRLGFPLPLPDTGGQVFAAAPDGSSLAALDAQTMQAVLYNWRGERLRAFDQPPAAYNASYSPDSRYLAISGAEEMAVFVYDLQGDAVTRLSGFETAAPVYSVIAAPGGQHIAWISRATLQFQSVETGEMGGRLSFVDFIGPAVFTPDGQRLALSVPGRLEIYSVPAGELLQGIDLGEPLYDLAFSPDGTLIAAAYGQGIQVWDAASLAPLARLDAETTPTRISFSPDGRILVTIQEEPELKIWTVE